MFVIFIVAACNRVLGKLYRKYSFRLGLGDSVLPMDP